MALTFFWRCENDTALDGTHDFSVGDTTPTANNTPSISATAAKVGSNGILIDSSADRYDFNPTGIISPVAGSIAFWFQFPTTSIPGAPAMMFVARGSASASDTVSIGPLGTEVRLQIRRNLGTNVEFDTSGAGLAVGNWYWLEASWDQPNSDKRIAVYDSSGTLLAESVDTTTAFDQPTALDLANGLRFGDSTGWAATRPAWFDNIFIGDAYADAPIFRANKNITSFTEFDDGEEESPPLLMAQASF